LKYFFSKEILIYTYRTEMVNGVDADVTVLVPVMTILTPVFRVSVDTVI
jgi:hypothetical protein